MRARFYDPAIGRFINADPLEGTPSAPQTQNRYAYALNNPTNLVDPTGLDSSEGGGGALTNAALGSLREWPACIGFAVSLLAAPFGPWGIAASTAINIALAVNADDTNGAGWNGLNGGVSLGGPPFIEAMARAIGFDRAPIGAYFSPGFNGLTGILYNAIQGLFCLGEIRSHWRSA